MKRQTRKQENAAFRAKLARLSPDQCRMLIVYADALVALEDNRDRDSAWLSDLAVRMPWMIEEAARGVANRRTA